MNQSCYMCNLPGNEREHVPPLCLFPEEKDFGHNLRKNLITVPSCPLHNSHKSKDDEYFRSIVVPMCSANSSAKQLFESKFLRAASRRPKTYKSFFTDKGIISGNKHALEVDRCRIDRCIDRIVRGIHFHEQGTRLEFPVHNFLPSLLVNNETNEPVAHEPSIRMAKEINDLLGGVSDKGLNREVFSYKAQKEFSSGAFFFSAVFYEIFEVFAFSSSELVELKC